MAVVSIGEKWDATSCSNLSATTSSFDISSWPRGDHYDANDYSASGECYEAASTSKAEIVTTLITGLSSDDVVWTYYDPFGRKIYSFSGNNIDYGMAWLGRFGEENLPLEIYRPGMYKCVVVVNGSTTYTKYFDVYDQTSNKYVHKQGNDSNTTGNSWGAAKATWSAGQTALSAGNDMYVGAGNYSSESVTLNKTMDIMPSPTFGGYHNITDSYTAIPSMTTPYLIADVGRPIEFDGTIDRWAFYKPASTARIIKLKIYRGGDSGTSYATTSTLVYTSSAYTGTGTGWIISTISPAQSVQRGDIVAIQSNYPYNSVGLRNFVVMSASDYGVAPATVSGDPGNTVLGTTGLWQYVLLARAWKSTDEILMPVT